MLEATKDRKVLGMERTYKTHPPRNQESEEVSHQETISHAPDRNARAGLWFTFGSCRRPYPTTPLCQRR